MLINADSCRQARDPNRFRQKRCILVPVPYSLSGEHRPSGPISRVPHVTRAYRRLHTMDQSKPSLPNFICLISSASISQHVPANDQSHDFVGAFQDLVHPHIAQDPLDGMIAQIAIASVEL
jgi:hypothetical protein